MTKADKLIFWGVLGFSVLFLLFSNVIFAKTGERKVVIEVNGKSFAAYQMEHINQVERLTVPTEAGSQEIEISKESVKIITSSCKDGLCLGEIKNPGEMLVCLPNRVIVRIEAEKEVDGIAY